jgi:putative transposase
LKASAELAEKVGVRDACLALGVSRATFYRRRQPPVSQQPRPTPPRALSQDERQAVLDVLTSERFVDRSPAEVVATLADEGVYVASERTMYRVLAAEHATRERRNQLRHPAYQAPELVAKEPNQVWSWDITKLLGPVPWTYFYLYVIIDIFSRYVVGWMIADSENASLAGRLITETYDKHGIQPEVLTLHSDRGAPMTAKCTAQLMADLGITRSLSRPRVSDDNPISEAHFKTLKYHPGFPRRFQNSEVAQAYCRTFFPWYNTEHRHAGIAMLTPEVVYEGRADQVLAARQAVMDAAYAEHPERFPRGRPRVPRLAPAVYINPPKAAPSKPPDPDAANAAAPPPDAAPPLPTEAPEMRQEVAL